MKNKENMADDLADVQRGVSKTFCCKECGEQKEYIDMAAYTETYLIDKKRIPTGRSSIEMICMDCYYREPGSA